MRYLGTIVVGAGAAEDNSTTASPFTLPKNACSLAFVPSATGLLVRYGAKAAIGANDFPLLADSHSFPWAGRDSGLVALKNPTGGSLSCKVYATDYPGIPTIL